MLGGDNLGFFPLGTIGRRAGVVFIRRSFRDDEVYKLALREYMRYLVASGANLEWYMEGGRSRTGKLRPPQIRSPQLSRRGDGRAAPPRTSCSFPCRQPMTSCRKWRRMAAEEAGVAKVEGGLRAGSPAMPGRKTESSARPMCASGNPSPCARPIRARTTSRSGGPSTRSPSRSSSASIGSRRSRRRRSSPLPCSASMTMRSPCRRCMT